MKKNISYFDLNIGPYCKKDCIFCSEGGIGKRNYITLDEFKKIYINNNIKKVVLTGGEPLLNEDIIEYIKVGVKNKSIVGLVTSGDDKLDSSFLIKLLEAGISEIMFSLEGPRGFHDKIVKREGSYDIILKALYDLSVLKSKFDFQLIINTNINLLNYKFLPNFIIRMLKTFNIDIYHIQWLENDGSAKNNFSLLFGKYSKLLYGFNNNSEIYNYADKIKFGRVPFCVLNERLYKTHTNTNYEITTNDSESINKYSYLDSKYIDKKCKGCFKFDECEYFYQYYIDLFGKSEILPIYDFYTIDDIYNKHNLGNLGICIDAFKLLVQLCNGKKNKFSYGEEIYLFWDYISYSNITDILVENIKTYFIEYKYLKSKDIFVLPDIMKTPFDPPFIYYNKNKNYLFSSEFAYLFNIIGYVSFNLIENNVKLIHDKDPQIIEIGTLLNFVNSNSELILSDLELEKFINGNTLFTREDIIKKGFIKLSFPGLLTIANKFLSTNDLKYIDLFYEQFEEKISLDYEDEQVFLFFLMKKADPRFNNYSINYMNYLNSYYFL